MNFSLYSCFIQTVPRKQFGLQNLLEGPQNASLKRSELLSRWVRFGKPIFCIEKDEEIKMLGFELNVIT